MLLQRIGTGAIPTMRFYNSKSFQLILEIIILMQLQLRLAECRGLRLVGVKVFRTLYSHQHRANAVNTETTSIQHHQQYSNHSNTIILNDGNTDISLMHNQPHAVVVRLKPEIRTIKSISVTSSESDTNRQGIMDAGLSKVVSKVQSNVQPILQSFLQPNMQSNVQSNIQPNMQSNVQPNIQSNVQNTNSMQRSLPIISHHSDHNHHLMHAKDKKIEERIKQLRMEKERKIQRALLRKKMRKFKSNLKEEVSRDIRMINARNEIIQERIKKWEKKVQALLKDKERVKRQCDRKVSKLQLQQHKELEHAHRVAEKFDRYLMKQGHKALEIQRRHVEQLLQQQRKFMQNEIKLLQDLLSQKKNAKIMRKLSRIKKNCKTRLAQINQTSQAQPSLTAK